MSHGSIFRTPFAFWPSGKVDSRTLVAYLAESSHLWTRRHSLRFLKVADLFAPAIASGIGRASARISQHSSPFVFFVRGNVRPVLFGLKKTARSRHSFF